MRTLWRKTLRDVRAARWQTGGVALLVAVIVALMAGSGRARSMMVASRDGVLERLNAPDLDIRCSPTLPGVLDALEDLPGVAAMEERMLLEGALRAPGMPTTPAVVRILPQSGRPAVYRLELIAGRWPDAGEEALLVDRSVLRHRNVHVGDEVELQVLDVVRTFPVVGVVLDAEHLLHPAHPDFEVPIPGALAAVHASAAAAAHLPYGDRVDSLLFRFAADEDAAALGARVRERLPVAVLGAISGSEQPSRRMTDLIVSIFDIYTPTVALVLIAVALSLFVMTISRQVRRQRLQIGVLLAIGTRPSSIAASMLVLAVVPTVLGGLLGMAGHLLVAHMVFDAHAVAIGWPPLIDPGPGPEALVTLLAAAAVAVASSVGPALLATRKLPAHLLQHESWDALRRTRGAVARFGVRLRERLRLPMQVLLGFSTVARRRLATATAGVALAANFAVVLAFLFVHVSHDEEVQLSFNRLGLNAVVRFDKPQTDDAIRAAASPAWTKIEPLITRIAWFQTKDRSAFIRLTCIEPDGWLGGIPIAKGRPFSSPDAHELHLDHWLATRHGISLGDRVTCYPYYSAPEGMELEVTAILDGVSMGLIAIPLETGRALYGLPGLSTGVHIASALPREPLIATLHELPDVADTVYTGDARDHVQRTFNAARFVLTLAMAMAVLVAVIFLGILAALDAAERSRDFAILRALGWGRGKVFGLCVTEVATRGYLALLLSLPAAAPLAHWMLGQIEAANHYRMPLHDPLWIYVTVAIMGAVLIPLGAVPAWRVAVAPPSGSLARLLARR